MSLFICRRSFIPSWALAVYLCLGIASVSFGQAVIKDIEPFSKDDRIFILAPHPDDEAIGCGGIIQEAMSKGADVRVIYLTNGDHNQFAFIVYEKRLTFRSAEFIHMGKVRRDEAIKAMAGLGLNKDKLTFLGYPDFGTFTIFRDYWQSKKPFKSLLTRISKVPYKEDLSYGQPYVAESILGDIKKLLKEYRPNKIFVSHPADVNVDHKTFYLFLEVALSDLENDSGFVRPKVYPYLIHRVGWPLPRHYHPSLSLNPPEQLSETPLEWFSFDLNQDYITNKHKAILCYPSQTRSSAFYLLAFVRKNELFSNYPEVNLYEPSGRGEKIDAGKNSFTYFLAHLFTKEDASPGQVRPVTGGPVLPDWLNMKLEGDRLIISVKKAQYLFKRVNSLFYIFGYNKNRPFAAMPKIRIMTKAQNFKILDGRKLIKPGGSELVLDKDFLVLKIPVNLLGDPDFILISAKAYTGNLPFHTTGFHKVNLKKRE